MKLTIDTTSDQDAGLQFAADSFNASAKQSHDAAQSRLPEKDRVAYSPLSPEDYAVKRFGDVLDSYAKQAVDAAHRELLEGISKLSKSERDALKSSLVK